MKRRLAQSLLATRIYAAIAWAIQRRLDRKAVASGASSQPREGVVILAANGGGNIGDQALLEAALDASTGPVVVLAKSRGHVTIPEDLASRVTVVETPQLLDPLIVRGLADQKSLRSHLARASEFWVIGADLMDGLYNPAASLARASMLVTASAMGVKARALGFSWPDRPVPTVASKLRDADAVAQLFARDPISHGRMIAQGFTRVQLASDIVFGNARVKAPVELEGQVSAWREQGKRIALVNISALVGARMNQSPEYGVIFAGLAELGYAVVVLPHVIRSSGDDLAASQAVLAAAGVTPDVLVERLLEPAESRWLASKADVVVTGRMHLAVLALTAATPAITLGTQGKVEGLFQMFEAPEFAVAPTAGFGHVVTAQIASIHENAESVRAGLAAHVPDVVERAASNFA